MCSETSVLIGCIGTHIQGMEEIASLQLELDALLRGASREKLAQLITHSEVQDTPEGKSKL